MAIITSLLWALLVVCESSEQEEIISHTNLLNIGSLGNNNTQRQFKPDQRNDPMSLSDSSERLTSFRADAAGGNASLAECLVTNGSLVHSTNKKELNALYLAVINDNPDGIQVLLVGGANFNVKTFNGSTSLHLVATNDNMPAAGYILGTGKAKISFRDGKMETPLEISKRLGFTKLADILEKNVMELNSDLFKAAEKGELADLKSLVKRGAELNSKDAFRDTPLLKAVKRGNMEITNYLLMIGADINSQSTNGWTPLHWAIALKYTDIVETLMTHHDVNINMISADMQTPLHLATINNNFSLVANLLTKGALVELHDNEGFTALHLAAIYGNRGVITLLLKHGADINARTANGSTALHLSACRGHLDTVKFIIAQENVRLSLTDNFKITPQQLADQKGHTKVAALLADNVGDIRVERLFEAAEYEEELHSLIMRGADVNGKDKYGWTPILVAATYGQTNVVNRLIENGANVNIKDVDGRTALHVAALKGRVNVVESLVQNGANINIKDDWGQTPLLAGAAADHLPVVKYLIENGADSSTRDRDMRTPLIMATINGCFNVYQYLVENGAGLNDADGSGETPLHKSVIHDHMQLMKYLIKEGADINAQSAYGWTPLQLAVALGRNELVEELTKVHSIDINSNGSTGLLPLHIAAQNGEALLLNELLAKGAVVDLPTKDGLTALHLASINNNRNIINILLKKGADINARTLNGSTALHLLAANGDVATVRYILENENSNINLKDYNGETPQMIAKRLGFTGLANILEQKLTDINSDLIQAVRTGQVGRVNLLIARGASVNSTDIAGETPLHKAVRRGDLEITKHLINLGIDVNKQSTNGWTPLHISVSNGNINLTEYLLAHGANMEVSNEYGQTALHLAAINNHLNAMNVLLQKGANINALTVNGSTALHLSVLHGNLQMVQYILNTGIARMSAKNVKMETPLMLAEQGAHTEIAKLLRETIGDIDVDHLLEAATHGNLSEVRSLVLRGAPIEGKDDNGLTPLWLAAHKGHSNVVQYLIGAGADLEINDGMLMYGKTALSIAALNGRLEVVKSLVEAGANLETRDSTYHTPLINAALNGHVEVVKYLADIGADFKAESSSHHTALSYAAEYGHPETVEFLVKRGADLETKAILNETPLILAIKGHTKNIKVIKILVDNGAQLNAKDKQGNTAVSLAEDLGLTDIAGYLASKTANS